LTADGRVHVGSVRSITFDDANGRSIVCVSFVNEGRDCVAGGYGLCDDRSAGLAGGSND